MRRFFLFVTVISLVIATSCGTSATPTVSVTPTPTASATNVSARTSTPTATTTTVGNVTATVPLPTATTTTVGNVTATVPLGLGVQFVHTATLANILGDSTYINNPLTNNNPNAIVFVTPNWNPGGVGNTYDNHPIGVWYDGSKWAIFNQDLAAMPVGAAFNVLIPTTGTAAFVQTATLANILGDSTYINNPLTNNNPNAIVLVTPNWNPGGVGNTYDDHSIGVWYDGSKWAIFNQDMADMPVGAAFNVLIPTAGAAAFVHTATLANILGDSTYINNPLTNNNPNAIVFVTPNWNPGGVGNTYDDHPIGVWYDGSKWAIFNQDIAAMPADASFNVLIP